MVGHQYTLIGQTINLSFTFKVRQNVQCPLYVGLSTDILRPALNICYKYCSLSLIFYNYEAFWRNCQFLTIIKYCLYILKKWYPCPVDHTFNLVCPSSVSILKFNIYLFMYIKGTADSGRLFNANNYWVHSNSCIMTFLGRLTLRGCGLYVL